jgi:hypothetical protein
MMILGKARVVVVVVVEEESWYTASDLVSTQTLPFDAEKEKKHERTNFEKKFVYYHYDL